MCKASVVAEAAFNAQPEARQGRWVWDDLESVAVNALSRVGGGAGDLEQAARDVYAALFRAGMSLVGVDDFTAQGIFVDAKPHFLSSEFMEEWIRTRFPKDDQSA